MTKLRATRAQVIAAAVIAALAIVVGVVGLYGLNARGSESGAQVLEDMRLQAILNTAGSGAVDAYVAAAKSEASTKARESGGGMSAVREAAAKAEEEARAKAEELGIGAVDLTEINTEPMSAALDVLLAAQRAYFAEEASAQAAYAAQAAQSAPAIMSGSESNSSVPWWRILSRYSRCAVPETLRPETRMSLRPEASASSPSPRSALTTGRVKRSMDILSASGASVMRE